MEPGFNVSKIIHFTLFPFRVKTQLQNIYTTPGSVLEHWGLIVDGALKAPQMYHECLAIGS